ncbi:hypothetical protein ACFY97_17185 [Streptomyces klenkii]|uniref:hypothetical protein n=1 Tax=Streptomyces klenkii TaxID=1420899 RepID=UPI0036F139FB
MSTLTLTGASCTSLDSGPAQSDGSPKPVTMPPKGKSPHPSKTSPPPKKPPSPSVTTDDAPGQASSIRISPLYTNGKGLTFVSCGDIHVDITLQAHYGRARWKAVAVDFEPRGTENDNPISPDTSANIARGVRLEPSSGVLESGQTQVLHIRGAYDPSFRPDFWVAIDSRSGRARESGGFVCR